MSRRRAPTYAWTALEAVADGWGDGESQKPIRVALGLVRPFAEVYECSGNFIESSMMPDHPRFGSAVIAEHIPLIVFSHLRWNFVFQRPQHLMTRMASTRSVFFVEEPVFDAGAPFLETRQVQPGLHVITPHTPIAAAGFHDDQVGLLTVLLREEWAARRIAECCAWFYTPMALPLLGSAEGKVKAVIYDCMDELSAFSKAPAQLKQREQALLRASDVVFTGGPSLYAAKRTQHHGVHCFPSAVDQAHFAAAAHGCDAHPALSSLARPRLGFFGVIDERCDIDLLAHIARARPDWQLCMVGPVVKIDPLSLPRGPNIHYYGQRSYGELPSFVAGWDVCLLPFALNEATRYISPTKTLEYMAAEQPIVSTPVVDVADLYSDVVHIAGSAEEFVQACERALAETPAQSDARRSAMRALVSRTSWDKTAASMAGLIDDVVAGQRRRVAPAAERYEGSLASAAGA